MEYTISEESLDKLYKQNDALEAELASLTAGSEAMQEDAVQNASAFNLMLIANKEQAEEIRTLKQVLTETLVALQAWQAIHPDDWDSGDKNAVTMAEKALERVK